MFEVALLHKGWSCPDVSSSSSREEGCDDVDLDSGIGNICYSLGMSRKEDQRMRLDKILTLVMSQGKEKPVKNSED